MTYLKTVLVASLLLAACSAPSSICSESGCPQETDENVHLQLRIGDPDEKKDGVDVNKEDGGKEDWEKKEDGGKEGWQKKEDGGKEDGQKKEDGGKEDWQKKEDGGKEDGQKKE